MGRMRTPVSQGPLTMKDQHLKGCRGRESLDKGVQEESAALEADKGKNFQGATNIGKYH